MPNEARTTSVEFFTENEQLIHLLDDLEHELGQQDKPFSDVVDSDDNYYVDLVMEGGGVLGLALVGYTYVLEKMGLRFFGLGGTSAGSINAAALACAGEMQEPKSVRILEALAKLDMYRFVDGDADAEDFVRRLVEGAKPVTLAWKGMQVIDNLRDDYGLNPGDAFTAWCKSTFADWGIRKNAELSARRRKRPRGLRRRDSGVRISRVNPRLAIIAAEITTETKVEFPRMAELFWKNTENVSPAEFVRASMSIPYFFRPYRVQRLPSRPKRTWVTKWSELAGYRGELPKEAIFVDGGIMSNFPINLFHIEGTPSRPTFGAKLGTERDKPRRIKGPLSLGWAAFNAARHTLDYDFFLSHPEYRKLVTIIPTGTHNWLNFGIEPEDQLDLFLRGAKAAARFLLDFDWERYRDERAEAAAEEGA